MAEIDESITGWLTQQAGTWRVRQRIWSSATAEPVVLPPMVAERRMVHDVLALTAARCQPPVVVGGAVGPFVTGFRENACRLMLTGWWEPSVSTPLGSGWWPRRRFHPRPRG